MEISGKVSPIKIDAYINNVKGEKSITKTSGRRPGPVLDEDKVDLSETAKEIKKLKAQLEAVPDIREEKVEGIKNQIRNETYRVDGKKIAHQMVKNSIIDEIV